MNTEMALTTRPSFGPVRRLAMVLTVSVIAGLGSVAIAPAASADDDEKSVATSVEIQDDEDSKDDKDDKATQDGPDSVVLRSGHGGPDAFILFEHGRKPVFFCDVAKGKKQHKVCINNTAGGSRF